MGKRAGLTGARSGLFYHVLRVADAYRATWVFLENIPGVCANGLNLVVGALEEHGFRFSVAGSLGELTRRATRTESGFLTREATRWHRHGKCEATNHG